MLNVGGEENDTIVEEDESMLSPAVLAGPKGLPVLPNLSGGMKKIKRDSEPLARKSVSRSKCFRTEMTGRRTEMMIITAMTAMIKSKVRRPP